MDGKEEKVAYFQLVLTTNRPSVVNSVNPRVELCKASAPPYLCVVGFQRRKKKMETDSLHYLLTVSVS